MKRLLCLFLALIFITITLVGCASQKTSVGVKIVVDQSDDGVYDKTIYDGTVELVGSDPSIDSIIKTLSDEKTIKADYSSDVNGETALVAINDYMVKDELKDADELVFSMYLWTATINGAEVSGLWSDAFVTKGDTVVISYVVKNTELITSN